MKLTINQNLHIQMKELSRRKKRQTGLTIGGFYGEAIVRYVNKERIPKKVEKITRKQYRFDVPKEIPEAITACGMIARKRKVALSVVLEEAIEEYLAIPENYLGEKFYKKIKKEYF